MATKTQTPIETLKRARIYNCRSADPEHCKLPICIDARAALEDVEALVGVLRGEHDPLQCLDCQDSLGCDTKDILDKFTVKS